MPTILLAAKISTIPGFLFEEQSNYMLLNLHWMYLILHNALKIQIKPVTPKDSKWRDEMQTDTSFKPNVNIPVTNEGEAWAVFF